MTSRRALSALLIVAGAALLGAVALHYLRGARAQEEGANALRRGIAGGYATVSTKADSPPARRDDLPRSGYGNPAANYPVGQPLGHLRIPSARMDWVVFAGADDATLEKGPGHVPGTAMPGQDGSYENCVITAHRDAHFRHLGWLRKGHMIELDTPSSGVRRYRVVSREIVTPKTVRVLAPSKTPRLTLITCYPFTYIGPAPKRLVIVAEPVPSPRTRSASATTR
ncbi:MAG TPA: class D sortase [Thermoanaerobaculia bacterium]|jgi:sortase A|nr:class D sortase [Thermoanaerobaculia bacterium]